MEYLQEAEHSELTMYVLHYMWIHFVQGGYPAPNVSRKSLLHLLRAKKDLIMTTAAGQVHMIHTTEMLHFPIFSTKMAITFHSRSSKSCVI